MTTGMRAADADRERVAERLRWAQADGRIDLTEFDERLAAVYAARTYDDLEPLTADLPVDRPAPDPASRVGKSGGWPSGTSGRRARGRALALRIEAASWALASAANVLIWTLVSVGSGHAVYPWWMWVAGPWGLVLLARAVLVRALPGFEAARKATYTGDTARDCAGSVVPPRTSGPGVGACPTTEASHESRRTWPRRTGRSR